jgi:hypothetical protein
MSRNYYIPRWGHPYNIPTRCSAPEILAVVTCYTPEPDEPQPYSLENTVENWLLMDEEERAAVFLRSRGWSVEQEEEWYPSDE